MAEAEEIQKLLKSGGFIIGTNRTIKYLKSGRISRVYVSSNCPQDIRNDMKYYGELSETPIIELDQTNEELGNICKKPFYVSVLSVLKE